MRIFSRRQNGFETVLTPDIIKLSAQNVLRFRFGDLVYLGDILISDFLYLVGGFLYVVF